MPIVHWDKYDYKTDISKSNVGWLLSLPCEHRVCISEDKRRRWRAAHIRDDDDAHTWNHMMTIPLILEHEMSQDPHAVTCIGCLVRLSEEGR